MVEMVPKATALKAGELYLAIDKIDESLKTIARASDNPRFRKIREVDFVLETSPGSGDFRRLVPVESYTENDRNLLALVLLDFETQRLKRHRHEAREALTQLGFEA